jgi:hypothetical protein
MKRKIKDVQNALGLKPDGIAGSKTWGAIHLEICGLPDKSTIPNSSTSDVTAFYGDKGDESNLVWFNFQYPMYLYGDATQPITRHRCHKLCKDDLEKIFKEIGDTFSADYITEHHLDHYDGCFNDRPTRGGSTPSKHSWGIAIDIAADINGNQSRRDQADMPWEVVEIFEKHGWKSGGRAWGRDFMHFQRTT